MEILIGVWVTSLVALYSLGLWFGRRPVNWLREAKDRADKKIVDVMLERDAAKEFGDAIRQEAITYKAIAEGLERRLNERRREVPSAKKVAKARKVPVKRSKAV